MGIRLSSSAIVAFLLSSVGVAWGQETPVPAMTPMSPMTPAPVITPMPLPTVEPTTSPHAFSIKHEGYVAGDWVINPRVFNEFAAGNPSNPAGVSTAFRGAAGFGVYGHPMLVSADYRTYVYQSLPGTAVPAGGPVSPGSLNVEDRDFEARLAISVFPHVYVGGGYDYRADSYGVPSQSGFGAGVEVTPNFDRWRAAPYGSAYYYPQLGAGSTIRYHFLKYLVGAAVKVSEDPAWPVFVDVGYLGDNATNMLNAPSNFSHQGPFVGAGLHF